jgi:murein biosynthesis integral membrane protein MurJ
LAAAAAILSGLLLDTSIAASFGANRASDAFFVAARLPLGLIQMVLVGANQALVPAVSTWLVRRGEAETWRLTSHVFTLAMMMGGAVAGVGALAAQPLMRLTAPGFTPDEVSLAASLARVMFLVVPLVAGAEVLRSLLNARYSFLAPAAMNVVMNGLAAAIILVRPDQVHVIPLAYVAGAGAQLGFMVVVAKLRGFRYHRGLGLTDPAVAEVGRLCVRPLLGAGLNPVARVGEQAVVSFLPPGSITILNYGGRLISAIGGSVFFRSVVVALVPRLTQATARKDQEEVQRITRLGVQIMLAVSIPLTVFVAVLAQPAAVAIFQRGDFSRSDSVLLGLLLTVFAASLVGLGMQRALLAPFFARLDTRTPLRNTVYGITANLLMLPAAVLAFSDDELRLVVAVAVAFSLSQYVNVAHAWSRLRQLGISLRGLGGYALRIVAGSVLAGVAMVVMAALLDLYRPQNRTGLLVTIMIVALGGVAALTLALALLSASELRRMRISMRQRRPSTSQ